LSGPLGSTGASSTFSSSSFFNSPTSSGLISAGLPDGAVSLGVQLGVWGAPTTYTIPPNTAVIIRKYVSNKGYRTYYVYRVIDGELITILDEKNSFEIGEAPLTELERKAVEWFREMLFREMLEGQEVWVEKGVEEGGRL